MQGTDSKNIKLAHMAKQNEVSTWLKETYYTYFLTRMESTMVKSLFKPFALAQTMTIHLEKKNISIIK